MEQRFELIGIVKSYSSFKCTKILSGFGLKFATYNVCQRIGGLSPAICGLLLYLFAGIRGIYQGLTVTMMKQGTNQAIRFFVMESLKELYRGKENVNKPVPKLVTGMFGVVAGAASVFGNTPLDVIKTRMQVKHLSMFYSADRKQRVMPFLADL